MIKLYRERKQNFRKSGGNVSDCLNIVKVDLKYFSAIRAELALKLRGLFEKKAKENLTTKSFLKEVEKSTVLCQNSDNPLSTKSPVTPNNQAIENRQLSEIEEDYEENPTVKPVEKIDTKKELAKIAGM